MTLLPAHAMYLLLLIGCLAMTPLRADVIDIDSQQLKELQAQGVPVIDVRREEEWTATGVIEGSKLMTFFDAQGSYDAVRWFEKLSKAIDISEPVILICHSGVRSSIISKWLGKQIDTVYNLDNGIGTWIEDQQPTVAP